MDTVTVQCPYCFELVAIVLEPDLSGSMVWDCEVCCRPWQMQVMRRGTRVRVRVERAQ